MRYFISVMFSCLLACAPDEMTPVEQPESVVVRAEMQRSQVETGEAGLLVVNVESTGDWTTDLTSPEIEGLVIEPVPMQVSESFGRRTETFEFHLTGGSGSYVIPSFEVIVTEDDESVVIETPVMFFDIGEPRFSSDLSGLIGPPVKPDSPWPRRLMFLVAGLAVLSAIVWFFKWMSNRASLPVPLPPEDEEALSAWRAVCDDGQLSDHKRALALSRIFRRYLERRFLFGASAMTTREVVASSIEAAVIGETGDVERLLSATDLIKFAGQRGGEQLFVELGSDLVKFIESNGNAASAQEDAQRVEGGDV